MSEPVPVPLSTGGTEDHVQSHDYQQHASIGKIAEIARTAHVLPNPRVAYGMPLRDRTGHLPSTHGTKHILTDELSGTTQVSGQAATAANRQPRSTQQPKSKNSKRNIKCRYHGTKTGNYHNLLLSWLPVAGLGPDFLPAHRPNESTCVYSDQVRLTCLHFSLAHVLSFKPRTTHKPDQVSHPAAFSMQGLFCDVLQSRVL